MNKRKARTKANGDGTIYYNDSKKRWVGQYVVGIKADGKAERITRYGKTRKEVKEKLDALLIDLRTDKYVDKSAVLFKDITKQFIEDSYSLNKLSDVSYNRKLSTYKQICGHYIANMEIQKITDNDVKDFLIYITKYSNSVIGKIYGLANNTFKIAIRKNIIKDNPLEDKLILSKPTSSKRDKNIRGFTVEEQKEFLDTVTKHGINYKHQILLSMFTGMRMGEVNALNVNKDIDFKNKVIHIKRTLTKDKYDKVIMGDYTKTPQGERDIIMDEQVEFILNDYINNFYVPNKENLLFYNISCDKYITTSQVNMVFKRFCQKHNISLGYNVNQHMLRHTFATRCIESGMPANVLSKIMGHKDIRTTLEIYCDVFANYEKQHADRTYDYLKANNLLLVEKDPDTFDLNLLLDKIKDLHLTNDKKLVKLVRLLK